MSACACILKKKKTQIELVCNKHAFVLRIRQWNLKSFLQTYRHSNDYSFLISTDIFTFTETLLIFLLKLALLRRIAVLRKQVCKKNVFKRKTASITVYVGQKSRHKLPNIELHVQVDWLIIYCFTSHSRIFHLYGDVTIDGEGLQNSGLCSALRAGSLSCHTCCDTGPWFFWSHPKDRPIQSPLTTRMGMRRTYSNPDPHGEVGKDWNGRTIYTNIVLHATVHDMYLAENFYIKFLNNSLLHVHPGVCVLFYPCVSASARNFLSN
jgi:hypothetical protein